MLGKYNAVFAKGDHHFCSVPIPAINDNKDGTFDFTAEQIAAYSQSQTHPSIYYNASGWNGHKWWLCTTPYPSATGVFENPCMYYADDQQDGTPPVVWTPISGTSSGDYTVVDNPITKVPNNATINSDPDIIVLNNVMYMISRENTNHHIPYVQKSTDGQAWTKRGSTGLWDHTLISQPQMLSTGFIKIGDYIYGYSCTGTSGNYITVDSEKNRGYSWGIRIMRGTTFDNGGDFAYYKTCYLTGDKWIQPWHMDIFAYNNKYYIICCAREIGVSGGMRVFLAESSDGETFKMFARPLLDTYNYYRPTACVKSNGELVIYWSTTGATEVTADELPNGSSDISPDGRYIGMSHKKFSTVLRELNEAEVS